MSNRETLEAALAIIDRTTGELWSNADEDAAHETAFAAARRYLNLLPEPCGNCQATGTVWVKGNPIPQPCPTCHGRGTVYPAGLVDTIAHTIDNAGFIPWKRCQVVALAVLDAINNFAAGKPGREG